MWFDCFPERERPTDQRVARAVAAALSIAALLGFSERVYGQGAPANPLRMVGSGRLTLDPVCNARTGASLVLLLRNDGSVPSPLALSATEPASKTAGKPAVARVTITSLDATGRPAM